MSEYKHSREPVQIRGILEIKSLDWLSTEGRQLLQDAIRQRDGPKSGLTLSKIYGHAIKKKDRNSKLNAKVLIRATKLMAAGYLTSKCAALQLERIERASLKSLQQLN